MHSHTTKRLGKIAFKFIEMKMANENISPTHSVSYQGSRCAVYLGAENFKETQEQIGKFYD